MSTIETQRFIARKLPGPIYSVDWGLCAWEPWDTKEQKRAGATDEQLFVSEQICADYAANWSRAFGPPECCGACGHVFSDGETIVGHARYALLCWYCAAAREG